MNHPTTQVNFSNRPSFRFDGGVPSRWKPVVLQLLNGVAPKCQHKDCRDGKVNIPETCFAFLPNIRIFLPEIITHVSCSARVMDLESVMCELAGTSNTSVVPLLSLEREQFMCQVSPKNRSWLTCAAACNAMKKLCCTRARVHLHKCDVLVVRRVPPRLKTQHFPCRIARCRTQN